MGNPLKELQQFGQSLWYDNISRGLITSGQLAQMVQHDGLRGMTSNPAIFTAAITGSNEYDQAIKGLVRQNAGTAMDIYERLAVADIQLALDLLYPVYEQTQGVDGYVSLEVSPYLAHDTEATVAEARRLWGAVARDNLMIKVPATAAGIPAIRTLISEGLNVNVTLLFAVEAYEQVAEAYQRGLEDRLARGGDISRIASVASFFVSRIDLLIEDRITSKGGLLETATSAGQKEKLQRLLGKVAIANAKLAYARYQELYAGSRWKALAERGARPQRLLWASTGTKNPSYRKSLYVEELIGPDTVNTVPTETYNAFKEQGQLRPALTENWEQNIAQARATMALLAEVGISMKDITDTLLVDAVKKFSDPQDKLLASIEKKRQSLQSGLATQSLSLGSAAEALKKAQDEWRTSGKVRRLWGGDTSVWSRADENKWLGWLRIVDHQLQPAQVAAFQTIADDVQQNTFQHVVLLGMGGSSLAPEVWQKTFGRQPGFPQLHVLDSTVPAQIQTLRSQLDLTKTLFIVASKSGSTIEPNSFKQYFYQEVSQVLGAEQVGSRFVAITDPGTKMYQLAEREQFRHIFLGWPTIGGRFSALSPFGMIPLAAMGGDAVQFLSRARLMVQACADCVPPELNPGVTLGLALGTLAKQGRDKITVVASPGLSSLGAWMEQLVAESTGKLGLGIVPIDGEPLASPGSYGNDRVFVYERLQSQPCPDQDKAIEALEQAGHPVIRVQVPETLDLGQEMFRWEMATAVMGAVLGINPFDQPDVEAAKVAARALMTAYTEQGVLPAETPLVTDAGLSLYADPRNADALATLAGSKRTLAGLLKAHLSRLQPGDYFAINAYIEMKDSHDRELQALRLAVRDKFQVATTVGYGPRFLHSTGQLHKGGPNNGVFLQLTCDDPVDLPVPREQYTFSVLKTAQSQGDFQVLAERGRRIVRIHLGTDVMKGLKQLNDFMN